MRKNQNGFSVLEGLLLIVILGLIGFVGWYVWRASQNANKSLDNSADYLNTIAQQKREPEPNDIDEIIEESNLAEYKNESIGLSYQYPKDWRVVEETNDFYEVTFAYYSPDFYETPLEYTNKLTSGGIISMAALKDKHESLDVYIESGGFEYFSGDKEIQVQGNPALSGKCGHWTEGFCYVILHNKTVYRFSYYYPGQLDAPEPDTNKYRETLEKMIDSIKFEE